MTKIRKPGVEDSPVNGHQATTAYVEGRIATVMRRFVIPAFLVAILTTVASVGSVVKLYLDREHDRKCQAAAARDDVRFILYKIIDGFPNDAGAQQVRTVLDTSFGPLEC